MSPILVRPVREQLEHDRVIRLLHGKSKRRYDASMNPGIERNAAVGTGATALYPDLVLHSPERGKRLEAIVEVETGESVNHLEALAEWAHFAKVRAAFHLYVPAAMVDVARRLCEGNQIAVTEVWSYHGIGDDVRFTLVHRSKEPVQLAPPAPVVKRPNGAGADAAPRKPAAPRQTRAAAAVKAKRAAPNAKRGGDAKRSASSRTTKAAPARRKAAPAKKAVRSQKRK